MRTTKSIHKAFHIMLMMSIMIGLTINVFAVAPGGAYVMNTTIRGSSPVRSAGNISVVSGNITVANLEANQSTFRWAGLLGNVSGNIILGDSVSSILFTWSAAGRLVYASRQSSVAWGTLADATEASVVSHYSFLSTGTNDAYDMTFTGVSEPIDSGIFTLSSDFATTQTSVATTWKTYSLNDTNDIVFVGDVEENGDSYKSSDKVDYQMIVPEDGTASNSVATTYFLWVELI